MVRRAGWLGADEIPADAKGRAGGHVPYHDPALPSIGSSAGRPVVADSMLIPPKGRNRANLVWAAGAQLLGKLGKHGIDFLGLHIYRDQLAFQGLAVVRRGVGIF